jgi:hypothetical protein
MSQTNMDIEYISLLIDNNSVVNGLGESVKAAETIRNWGSDMTQFYKYLTDGFFPNNYSLFVPDFWHIAYGDAKCLPKTEADLLWESTVAARTEAMPFVKMTEMGVRPHPGTPLHFNEA